jgi:drug/metabolite transporter (DMT)-like permease
VVGLLRTLGIVAIVGAVLWMVTSEMVFHESRGSQVRLMLGAGVACLAASVIVSLATRVSSRVSTRKCPRCGKPVQQGHIYCQDHLKEAVNRFRDDQRQKGDLG